MLIYVNGQGDFDAVDTSSAHFQGISPQITTIPNRIPAHKWAIALSWNTKFTN